MIVIRTPEKRFNNLEDYPFRARYIKIRGLNMHYVDEGAGSETVLCLHGEPTWSYLYRKMIPYLAQRHRVIAPDFIGFGKSDKPTQLKDHHIHLHLDLLRDFILTLDLNHITLVCQDWGGILGLTVATDFTSRFKRLVIMNTGLPTGDQPMPEGFLRWRDFAVKRGTALEPGKLMAISSKAHHLSEAVIQAYDAPFPDASYRAAVAQFPLMIPLEANQPEALIFQQTREKLRSFNGPTLVMFSEDDPVTAGGEQFFHQLIPGAQRYRPVIIKNAGHFLQETQGPQLSKYILRFMEKT
ncbi:haloalkane dehalogenase [Anaerolineales bacterium]